MNAEKYTQKTLDAFRTAQSMAQENQNQYLTPEHLLYALLDQDGGLIPSIFGKMGVDCDGLLSELEPGDAVRFTDMDGEETDYEVVKTAILQPTDVEAVQNSGHDLVLYTCTYGGKTRVTVFCDRTEEQEEETNE